MIHELLPWMLTMGKYILASAALLVFYRLFLRKHASFRESRLFLLSVAFLALAVSQFRIEVTHPAPTIVEVEQEMPAAQQAPLLSVADGLSLPQQDGAAAIAETARMTELTGSSESGGMTKTVGASTVTGMAIKPEPSPIQRAFTWMQSHLLQLLLSLYIVVALTLVINLLLQYRSIRKLRRTGMGSLHDGYTLVEHPEVSTPFSFATTIFLPSNLSVNQRDIVVTHERWHIRHKHYVDVLVQEITCCLFWFNPVQWLLRKDLRSVHEFQADRSVLNEGCDVYRYQTVILEEVLGHHFRLANGFNQSFTKKRFIQMKQFEPLRLNAARKVASVCFFVLMFAALSVVPGKSQVIRVERSSTTTRTENGTTKTVTTRSIDTLSNVKIDVRPVTIDPTSTPGQIQRSFIQSVDSQLRMVNRVLPVVRKLARSPHPADNASDMGALLEALEIKANNEGISYGEFSQDAKNKLNREAFLGFEKTLFNMRDSLRLYRTKAVNRFDSPYLMGLVAMGQQLFSDKVFNTIFMELFRIMGARMGHVMDGMSEALPSLKGSMESNPNGTESAGSMGEAFGEMGKAMTGMMTTLAGAMSTQTANPVETNVDRTEVVRRPSTQRSGREAQRPLENRTDNDNEKNTRMEDVVKQTNQSVLANIAFNDKDKNIRIEAVRKLTNQSVLANVAYNDDEPIVRQIAVQRLTNESILANVAYNDNDKNVRLEAVRKLTNQSILANVAYNDDEPVVRLFAVQRLTNESILANVAYNDNDKNVRLEAVRKLTNQSILANVAYNDDEPVVRQIAVRRLTNESVLANVLQNDDDKNVRMEAMNRMEQLVKESNKRQPK